MTQLIDGNRIDKKPEVLQRGRLRLVLAVMLAAATGPVHAEVVVSGLFSDHMVLQRNTPIAVWGTAVAGERITVRLAGQQAVGRADDAGRWRTQLRPLDAGGPFVLTIAGTNTITLHDVMIGEVWVCSGQSNMAFPLKQAVNAGREAADADSPDIRLFTVPRSVADTPQTTVKGTWLVCKPQTAAAFSAVGYFFGRDLQKSLGVPIGLIHASWGGTPAEAWTARPALESDPDLAAVLSLPILTPPPGQGRVQPTQRASTRPAKPPGPQNRPAALYNGMVHPLIPYTIRGVIWYQGEANTTRSYAYRKVLPAMIRNWRADWGQGDVPFLIVQLANFQARQTVPYFSDWAELREAQLMALAVPKTALVVTIDIGEPDDIHPKNKQEVARRLALSARAIAYGQDIPYSGPIYKSHTVQGDRIRLRFDHADGGLAARGGEPLAGFGIAGKDRRFVDAAAIVEEDEIVVSSERVSSPVAVRYAWGDSPVCNLVNRDGLPASPFRTDDWPGITANRN